MNLAIRPFLVAWVLLLACRTFAVSPTPEELAEARRWSAAKFDGVQEAQAVPSGLVVIANYKEVQRNAREGQPLKIADRQYTHGLYCHAPSQLLVRLPGPGASFSAVVGIDCNGNYSGGSVVFTVGVDGQEAFRSKLMLRGQPGVPVKVDLRGATQFTLSVEDGGDNFNSDQASWAEAKATLSDGKEVWLGDLPVVPLERAPYDTEPPFSFKYDGQPSTAWLKTWPKTHTARALDEARQERVVTWRDPKTSLEVRCVAVEYKDFPTVEWTLWFKNTGTSDTPILSDIHALDTRLERGGAGEFTLHHHKGTFVRADDFEPLTTVLKPGLTQQFAPPGGRPLGHVFPYYNLDWSGQGVVLAVGWPGQWAAQFSRDEGIGLRLTAGQEITRLRLHPGEEVRGPLIVLQFWTGDWIRAQNVWRRWMLAHNVPRRAGQLPPPMMPAVSGNQFPGLLCNEADEIRYIDRYLEERIPITHWWMDAGWYQNRGDWTTTGTWEIDTNRFPRGLRYISDHAHAKGLKLIVWFEPERVTAGSWLAEQHPEWVLGGRQGGLLDLGNPGAWQWLVNHFDKLITEQGIDFYRQDFNMDPLSAWRANDTPDRQGITENKHVQGYLAFWDELVRRHPNLLIDSCASGGHRNDLETLRRALPLLRSDYIFDPVGEQGHTYGLALWMPYYGTGFIDFNTYIFRSLMGPDTTLSCDARRRDLDWDLLRQLVGQWRQVVPNYFGDFYPLMPYSLDSTVWLAWQFDRPEAGCGIVQAFRRADTVYRAVELRLRGLDPAATYEVTDLDTNRSVRVLGRELLEKGVVVELADRSAAALLAYRRIEP